MIQVIYNHYFCCSLQGLLSLLRKLKSNQERAVSDKDTLSLILQVSRNLALPLDLTEMLTIFRISFYKNRVGGKGHGFNDMNFCITGFVMLDVTNMELTAIRVPPA